MKVSVSIVTWNHEEFIGPCLESVLAQECAFDFEIVVGEDASTDRTREIVAEYARRYPGIIVPLFQRENVGVNANFRAVLSACRGEYIAHLDGDDLMLPGKLAKQVAFLDAHPECAICYHVMRRFDSATGATLGYTRSRFNKPISTIEDLVRYGPIMCNSSKLYRRASLPPEGIDPNTKFVIDWLFHIQSARTGSIGFLDEVLGEYRKHPGGTTALPAEKLEGPYGDQLYTLETAATYGVSLDAIAEGRARILAGQAAMYLKRGYFRQFREKIELSHAAGRFVNYRHAVLYILRRFPRLLARVVSTAENSS